MSPGKYLNEPLYSPPGYRIDREKGAIKGPFLRYLLRYL